MRDQSVTALQGFDSYELRLGDQLRGERASLGKSLLDVQRDLKIKAAYIDAIENCDASVFPNRGFIAGYVRSYSRYLNLDAEEVYRRFCDESGFRGVNSDMIGPRYGHASAAAARSGDSPALRGLDAALQSSRFLRPSAAGISLAALSGLGSVLMLAGLVGGLTYGGWYLLKDIQRIGFAPMAQAPDILGEPAMPASIDAAAPETGLPEGDFTRDVALNEIYAPRLEIPQVEPRDGPIAALDPDRIGRFGPETRTASLPVPGFLPDTVVAAAETPAPLPPEAVTVAAARPGTALPATPAAAPLPEPTGVAILARENAWVRVYESNGTVIFEKILDPGEIYQVPADLAGPLLRAGNAGAVYLRVGGRTYGPLGNGSSVAKRVSLEADQVATAWPATEVELPGAAALATNAALP